jgi:hypothetical protein
MSLKDRIGIVGIDDSEATSLEQIRAFPEESGKVRFAGQRREEVYAWTGRTLVRHQYPALKRREKGDAMGNRGGHAAISEHWLFHRAGRSLFFQNQNRKEFSATGLPSSVQAHSFDENILPRYFQCHLAHRLVSAASTLRSTPAQDYSNTKYLSEFET